MRNDSFRTPVGYFRNYFIENVIPELIKPAPYLTRGGNDNPHSDCKEVLDSLN